MLRVGTKYLTKSAAYTAKFAKTVLNLHLKHMDAVFGDINFCDWLWYNLFSRSLIIQPFQEKHKGQLRREIYGTHNVEDLEQAGLNSTGPFLHLILNWF